MAWGNFKRNFGTTFTISLCDQLHDANYPQLHLTAIYANYCASAWLLRP